MLTFQEHQFSFTDIITRQHYYHRENYDLHKSNLSQFFLNLQTPSRVLYYFSWEGRKGMILRHQRNWCQRKCKLIITKSITGLF